MTEYIDITRPVTDDIVSWPGRLPPKHSWEKSIALGHHCNASFWKMSAHSGTHMDAPLHFVDGGQPIDQVPADVFIGPCIVVDLSAHGDTIVDRDMASQYCSEKRILFRTQHSEFSDDGTYQAHRALLTQEAASVLTQGGMQLLGTDRLSVDDSRGDQFSVHHLVLRAGCVIVEGLQLANVTPGQYSLIVAPLRLTDTEASPVRALLRKA